MHGKNTLAVEQSCLLQPFLPHVARLGSANTNRLEIQLSFIFNCF